MSTFLNVSHIRTVKLHVAAFLNGLPAEPQRISELELATALEELAAEYRLIAAAKNSGLREV